MTVPKFIEDDLVPIDVYLGPRQKVNQIRKILHQHDEVDLTSEGCISRIEEVLMKDKIEHLRQGKWVANWTFGSNNGEVIQTYALMEHNDWETWYYPMTFFNVIRFIWNRLARSLGMYRWVKAG